MKVKFLIAPGVFAGAEKVVLYGAYAARQAGLDVEVLLLQEARAPQYADEFTRRAGEIDVPVRCIKVQGRVDWSTRDELSSILNKESEACIVHAHGYKALIYAWLLRKQIAYMLGTHHGITAHTLVVKIYHWVEFFLLKRCDLVFAVSETMRKMLLKKGLRGDRLCVQVNPLTLTAGENDLTPWNAQSEIRMVSVGRLSPEKALDRLLDALAKSKDFEFHLTIVGEGPCRQALQDQVAKLNLQANVEFVGYQTDVAGILAKHHVFVLPSLTEGLPLALIEAGAGGLCVLSSAVGATHEIVQDGQTGRLLPPCDEHAWIKALQELPENLSDFSQAARMQAPEIKKRYSLTSWAKTYSAALQTLIAAK